MEIAFDFVDYEYANCLMESIASNKNGFSCFFKNENRNYDILLTDNMDDLNDKIIYLSSDLNDDLSIFSPVSRIIDNIIFRYENNNGKILLNKESKCKLISFNSYFHCAGVTSISITFARLLRLEGYETLFISCDSRYTNKNFKRESNSLKLNYSLIFDKKLKINRYIEEDIFSLKMLYLTDYTQLGELISVLTNETQFQFIVIDLGTDFLDFCEHMYVVQNDLDKRNPKIELEHHKVLYNFSNRNTNNETIPYDSDAFFQNDNNIEISLNSAFANAIKRILRDGLNSGY